MNLLIFISINLLFVASSAVEIPVEWTSYINELVARYGTVVHLQLPAITIYIAIPVL